MPSLLTPESQKVLDKLASLSAFPRPSWRYHAGDLQHGESPSVDDAGWQAVTTPATLPAEAVWMRATFEVPKNLNGYDLTGTQISFRVRIDDERSVTQIVYFNGRRVAMGVDLEPIVLFADAHPGDKVLVAVKLLHTADTEEVSRFGRDNPVCRQPSQPGGFSPGGSLRFPASARPGRGWKRHIAEAAILHPNCQLNVPK